MTTDHAKSADEIALAAAAYCLEELRCIPTAPGQGKAMAQVRILGAINEALTAAREAWERERKATQLAADVNREFRDNAELRRRVEKAVDFLARNGQLAYYGPDGISRVTNIIMAAIAAKEGM